MCLQITEKAYLLSFMLLHSVWCMAAQTESFRLYRKNLDYASANEKKGAIGEKGEISRAVFEYFMKGIDIFSQVVYNEPEHMAAYLAINTEKRY